MPKHLLLNLRKELTATEKEGDAFPFISSLPWEKRDEKGETMLKQPGHRNEQLSLAPPSSRTFRT